MALQYNGSTFERLSYYALRDQKTDGKKQRKTLPERPGYHPAADFVGYSRRLPPYKRLFRVLLVDPCTPQTILRAHTQHGRVLTFRELDTHLGQECIRERWPVALTGALTSICYGDPYEAHIMDDGIDVIADLTLLAPCSFHVGHLYTFLGTLSVNETKVRFEGNVASNLHRAPIHSQSEMCLSRTRT